MWSHRTKCARLPSGYISHSPNFRQTMICLCFARQNDWLVLLTFETNHSETLRTDEQLEGDTGTKREMGGDGKLQKRLRAAPERWKKTSWWAKFTPQCHCLFCSCVQCWPSAVRLIVKPLNYCPWLRSKMLLIQQSPLCSVRVRAESVGNKYGLCLVLCFSTDLWLLLHWQACSSLSKRRRCWCSAVEEIKF